MAFVRVPGTARRFRDTDTGEEISRREYQKRVGRPLPRKAEKPMSRYNEAVTDFIKVREREGVRLTRGQVRRSQAMKDILADLKSGDEMRMRRALEAMGRRKPEWQFNVGETPT